MNNMLSYSVVLYLCYILLYQISHLVLFINFRVVFVSFRDPLWREYQLFVSHLTGKKAKPSNNSAVCDHLLHCNCLPSFEIFEILAHENKNYLLEIKEILPLFLFDQVS